MRVVSYAYGNDALQTRILAAVRCDVYLNIKYQNRRLRGWRVRVCDIVYFAKIGPDTMIAPPHPTSRIATLAKLLPGATVQLSR